MCGIAGWLSWDLLADISVVNRITNELAHRGPDASGVKDLGPVILGHRRLSIIDRSNANDQPLVDSTGRFWIVFNGEIYNFKTLRAELQSIGAQFNTQGDTEVVIEAYKRWGIDCLQRFNGMFAFALWDSIEERLLVARDRLGEKPLFYFSPDERQIIFASEPRALRKHIPQASGINPAALSRYLNLNYVPGVETLNTGLRKLLPAHYLLARRGEPFVVHRYWDLAEHFRNKRSFSSNADAAEQLDCLIADAVQLRLVSDVPLGAFLSGGIDSSTIVAAMARLGDAAQVKTFSIGFAEATFDELVEAKKAAGFLGVAHSERTLTPDPQSVLQSVIYGADEPLADSSFMPTYFLAGFAREFVTVALSGDGGDELFAGYETYVADVLHNSFQGTPSWATSAMTLVAQRVPVKFDKVSFDYKLKQFVAGLGYQRDRAHYSWRTIFSAEEKQRIMNPEWADLASNSDGFDEVQPYFSEVSNCHYIDQAMYADIKTWLPDDILVKVDRATMAHSLESRAPFLDHRLVEFAASLPVELKLKGLRKKHILKESQRKHLPSWILDRKKKGFNAPVSHWFDSAFKDFALEAINDSCMHDWFKKKELDRLFFEHQQKLRDNGLRLFGLTCLAVWLRQVAEK
jgi:asparagine synthase (glutamine-hydrolysing)